MGRLRLACASVWIVAPSESAYPDVGAKTAALRAATRTLGEMDPNRVYVSPNSNREVLKTLRPKSVQIRTLSPSMTSSLMLFFVCWAEAMSRMMTMVF